MTLLNDILLVAGLVLAPSADAGADAIGQPDRTMVYSFVSGGETIGKVTSRHFYYQRGNQLLRRVEEDTDIRIEQLFSSFVYNSRSVMKFDQQGLFYFDHNINMDKTSIRVSGKRSGNQFSINVKGISPDEIAKESGSTSVPLKADGHGVLSMEAFDITGQTLYQLAVLAGQKPQRLKVFDTEELKIIPVDVEWGGITKVKAAGRYFDCHTLLTKTSTGNDILYVAREGAELLLVMLEGTDEEDGDYVIKLVEYVHTDAGYEGPDYSDKLPESMGR